MYDSIRSIVPKRAAVFTLLVAILLTLPVSASETFTLDNGMQVILKENHNSPMIASMIFIRSGSKYESQYENGATHFLEHLLFDGTANQTREELDLAMRDLGGYINAFTRKEMTGYLVLLPRQYIDYGLAVQADMLFNSIFPEEELVKERQVVIEEIKQGADQPGYAAEAFHTQMALSGTDYARPVLGYEAFINNIPRASVIHYWKKYYRPENMTTLLIGDFDSAEMKKIVTDAFKAYPIESLPVDKVASEKAPQASQGTIDGQYIYDTVAAVSSTYIDFSFSAPHYSEADYIGFDLLTQYLALDGVSPLHQTLTTGADPLASELTVSIETFAEFSRLNISIITEKADQRKEIADTVLAILAGMSQAPADEETLKGIKTSVKCNDVYMADKLHYYGFIIAPLIMTAGWDFIQGYPDKLDQATWSDCQQAAATWLDDPRFVLTMVRPIGETEAEPYLPPSMTVDEVTAHFAETAFPEYELVAGHKLELPSTESISFELNNSAEFARKQFDNGLTVLVRTSPDSKVFAVNVLGKNRSAMEADSLAGITDFVNRMMETGTQSRDAAQLARDLNQIGANLTLYDNPWIPYDDRYTTRQFSFVKFETIDEFATEGLELLTDMLTNPKLDSAEIEKVRSGMMGLAGRQAGSVRDQASNLFYSTIFKGGPYAKPIGGSVETIGSITVEDLNQHHRQMYAPDNMIIAVSTKRPAEEIFTWLKDGLGHLEPVGAQPQKVTVAEGILAGEFHHEMDKEQIQIIMGAPFRTIDPADIAALNVAGSILSSRLYLNLREKQGLAYSIGAGVTIDKGFGWFTCSIGTGWDNYQAAIDGITLQLEKLKLDGPRPDEVTRARNQIWGQLMSAKLSRINQAYYMCVNEFFDRPLEHDQLYLDQLASVTPDSIRQVVSRYFATESLTIVSAGKKQ